jgi:HD-like signal output (HDOD) protein
MVLIRSQQYATSKRSPASYKDQIYSLAGLPTLPEIATEIMNIIRDDKMSASQIVPVIDRDPSLAMKLLKIANSVYYGMEEEIDSLRQAIVIIGMRELGNLAVGFSIIKAFAHWQDTGPIDWKRFWEHSIAAGHYAEILNGELKLRILSSPYSLGLLHDVGKLVLHRIEPTLYKDVLQLINDEGRPALEAEMEIFGITHMDAGKWIAEKWNLPEGVQIAIGYHHTPNRTPNEDYLESTALIHVVDLAVNLKGMSFGLVNGNTIPEVIEGWSILQAQNASLRGIAFPELLDQMNDYLEGIRHMIDIVQSQGETSGYHDSVE